MKLAGRRRLRIVRLRAQRLARRHYVTLISAVVLSGFAGVALTSASFELDEPAKEARAQAELAAVPTLPAAPSPTAPPASGGEWRQAIVYLVTDEAHAGRVRDTFSTLVWDHHLHEDDPSARRPRVHFLIAGTRETEATAIQTLNYYLEVAALQQVDLRVVDLRPSRDPAANTGAP